MLNIFYRTKRKHILKVILVYTKYSKTQFYKEVNFNNLPNLYITILPNKIKRVIKMKIAFFEVQSWEVPILKKKLKKHSLKLFPEPLDKENINKVKDCEIISCFTKSKFDKNIIPKLSKLKLIITRTTGFDHIDLLEAKKHKIMVCNSPVYGENTVAEHTFALILALSRNIRKSRIKTLNNDFSIEDYKGFDLEGKTLGVIGVGRIGKHVIRIARGFNMKVLAFDHHQDDFLAEELNFSYTTLNNLLKKSDIVTLHVPYTESNHHMINKKTLKLMKSSAFLINTARGGLVDTSALLEALDKEKLAGAGLDVLEGEQLIMEEKQLLYERRKLKELGKLVKEHQLLARDDVVFTPHIAFYSQEALERILNDAIKNINDYEKGAIDKTYVISNGKSI